MEDATLVRQAILDPAHKVHGYEILVRAGPESLFPPRAEGAGPEVVESAVHTFGLNWLTQGKPAFLSVTPRMLLQGFVSHVPAGAVVLQIPDTLAPQAGIPIAIQVLRRREGYAVALAGYVPGDPREVLLPHADWIKVDFRRCPPAVRSTIPRRLARPGLRFVAEGVESREDILEAIGAGYGYLQGFGFSRPEILVRRTLSPSKHAAIRLLKAVNDPRATADTLEKLFREDLPLSLKLLRYINSATFGLGTKISSIRHALLFLGLSRMRRWGSLLAVASLSGDTPGEVTLMCLIRARFCELVDEAVPAAGVPCDPFLLGMLSLLDVILGRPMQEIVADLPLAEEAQQVLLGRRDGGGRALALVEACERADWGKLAELCGSLGLPEDRIPGIYRQAVEWAEALSREEIAATRT